MSSEYRVVNMAMEKSLFEAEEQCPLHIRPAEVVSMEMEKPPFEGEKWDKHARCRAIAPQKKSPFEGGMIKRIERLIRGDDSRNVDLNGVCKQESDSPPAIPLRRFLPLKGDFGIHHFSMMGLMLILSATFASILHAQTANTVSAPYPRLEEYLRIAGEQNPELQSLQHLYRAELDRARESAVLMDPEITVAYDFNPMMADSYLGRFSISAMQMFPWFGSLDARRDLQQSLAEAERVQIDSRRLEILRDVQLAWLDIAEVHHQIQIAGENLELVRDLEELVKVRYETGRAGQADILRIQMEEQRLKTGIADLEGRIQPLQAQFNELLNRDLDAEVVTTDEIELCELHYSRDQLRLLMLNRNPEFERISAQESALNGQKSLARLEGRPSFGIGIEVMGRDFGMMSMFPDAQESFVGMASIRLPIYRTRTNAQIERITEQQRSLVTQRDQTENRLMAALESALEEIRRAERTVRLLDEELVPRAEQAFRILTDEYAAGNVRFDELLQIRRKLLELENERIEALAQQNRAVVQIKSLIGNNPP